MNAGRMMPISQQLLLLDYEKAKAAGDKDRAAAILKQLEKSGLPDRLKAAKSKPRAGRQAPPRLQQGNEAQLRVDPGRF